jgi:four helix bundle protein
MRKELIDDNPLLKLSIEFSLSVIKYCEVLDTQKKFILSKQLFRSATSIDANSMEAQNPESKADFIHKIKIAAKEAEETQYWLILCENGENYPKPVGLSEKLEVLNKILGSILSTAKRKTPFNYFLNLFIF